MCFGHWGKPARNYRAASGTPRPPRPPPRPRRLFFVPKINKKKKRKKTHVARALATAHASSATRNRPRRARILDSASLSEFPPSQARSPPSASRPRVRLLSSPAAPPLSKVAPRAPACPGDAPAAGEPPLAAGEGAPAPDDTRGRVEQGGLPPGGRPGSTAPRRAR